MAGLVPAISFAEPSVDGRAALRNFGNDIYVLAERDGVRWPDRIPYSR